MSMILHLLIFLISIGVAQCFANLLLKDCEKEISTSTEMMGTPVSMDFERIIEVSHVREEQIEEIIINGTSVEEASIKKSFIVKMKPPTNQCAFEVKGEGAIFPRGGKCSQKRVLCGNKKGALLELEGVRGSVEIVAAWGLSFNSGVKVSAPFVFQGPPAENGEHRATSLEL